MSEREQRFDFFFVNPAVSDIDAFFVFFIVDFLISTLDTRIGVECMGSVVCQLLSPSVGQFAAGIDVSGEDSADNSTRLTSEIPRL